MKELRTEIEIAASPQVVWKILTGFEDYSDWNPFIRKAAGHAKEGARIEIHLETPGGKRRKYEPTVTKADENRELRWLGKSSVLTGEHIFTIEQLEPGRVRLVQREVFGGLLSAFFGKSTDRDIKAGLEEMNRALKERAERSAY